MIVGDRESTAAFFARKTPLDKVPLQRSYKTVREVGFSGRGSLADSQQYARSRRLSKRKFPKRCTRATKASGIALSQMQNGRHRNQNVELLHPSGQRSSNRGKFDLKGVMWSRAKLITLCLLSGHRLSTEPPPPSTAPTKRSRMLNRLKGIFRSEPFNPKSYSMPSPGRFLKVSLPVTVANLCFRFGDSQLQSHRKSLRLQGDVSGESNISS